MEQVSTHTRSPIVNGTILVTGNGVSSVPEGAKRSEAIAASCSGGAVITMPSAPTSMVSRNSLASSVPLASAIRAVPDPWNAAMRFSRGITFQSWDDMIRRSAPFMAYAFSRSSGPATVTMRATGLPSLSTSSPRTMRALNLPRRRSGSSSSLTMMSVNPASRAAVTMFFLSSYVPPRSALTQMSLSMTITAIGRGPRPPSHRAARCRRPPSSFLLHCGAGRCSFLC